MHERNRNRACRETAPCKYILHSIMKCAVSYEIYTFKVIQSNPYDLNPEI